VIIILGGGIETLFVHLRLFPLSMMNKGNLSPDREIVAIHVNSSFGVHLI
jgi:hypothetical protein